MTVSKKQILTEYFLLERTNESVKTEDGFIYLSGLFQHANKKNGNGRVYPPRALTREIENYKKMDGGSMGISSRGLGSTRQEGDTTLVEDDFQLICFDLVSEASTPGAYLMKESQERDVFGKADRINRALNDILVGRK